MRILVQRLPQPTDWAVAHCDWAEVAGARVAPHELGERLSHADGIVEVRVGNGKATRTHEFDFAIASEYDMHGVDSALGRLIADGDITSGSISAFYDQALQFDSALHYTGGISEYLYWLADRRNRTERSSATRHREKLNRAAQLLADVNRPAALAITSLISFHFNHFDEAANRALSSRLRAVAARLDRMLSVATTPADLQGVAGALVHLEPLLMDELTASLIELCSQPLDASSHEIVANFDYRGMDSYDRMKALLFITEHHLALHDPRAVRLVRETRQNGVPENWVNSRSDLITNEGSKW
ncbi:hypothetical protein NOVA_21945 [Nocardia nova]|uniref:hypothetical protein n=1 Tax=Nocardia nova TaxID=37330 RepID=UPI001C444EB3|nr:hypothetical protein [Nocardia nova]MBV7705446.1 hypothetical protein [Nocardia nova]